MSDLILRGVAGLLAGPLLGGLTSGLDRILTARLQARQGPPLQQPYYDVVKLLAKELVVVNAWQAFCVYSHLFATVLAVVLFALQADLLLILFTEAVGAVFLVMGAMASTSPYSQIGAHRELLQILVYEPLLFLVAIGIYLETGSFRLTAVFQWPVPLITQLPLLFGVLCLVLVIKLRKSPFDLSAATHAHQELVRGLFTDFSGPLLGLIEIAHWYETVLMLAFCGLFWAGGLLPMTTLALAAVMGVILMDNATARLNWRWLLGYGWLAGMTLSLINLIWHFRGAG
ncbi:Respiratory-chain NADH dehydrogenase subunit 1 [Desulfosarcina cetonica]|uniref:complex I subunit 1 family protein n=1 Tax=Desulfosarcina cetonica TaxID=90730 RepID=UPI0006D0EA8C|nr:complex I subunit 1 family protein [Desulfosarcina cetonica]VTR65587.1 Respiratory-chain NADH dehydrogenase subunit 1 [Desulfosarcina cetonica]